jgi:natural product biosynthesis luciferase-like monooxygenase protein
MPAAPGLQYSLFFFGADSDAGGNKYEFLLESSQRADSLGFTAAWVPERHFARFGGLYGSPSVTATALAVTTKRLGIRAGSVVFPLQNALRVAEEWSMIDNLSNGRVAVAGASGWHANDFVLAPANFANRHDDMYSKIELVRRLWRGESVILPNGEGEPVETRIRPMPIQAELPIWITAQAESSFQKAGELGFNILTANFTNRFDPATFQQNVAMYRNAIQRHHGRRGHVTLMVHSYVATDENALEDVARPALISYLEANIEMKGANTAGKSADRFATMSPQRREIMTNARVNQMFDSKLSFVGTVDTCASKARALCELGADELACLMDFGIPLEENLASLSRIAALLD